MNPGRRSRHQTTTARRHDANWRASALGCHPRLGVFREWWRIENREGVGAGLRMIGEDFRSPYQVSR